MPFVIRSYEEKAVERSVSALLEIAIVEDNDQEAKVLND